MTLFIGVLVSTHLTALTPSIKVNKGNSLLLPKAILICPLEVDFASYTAFKRGIRPRGQRFIIIRGHCYKVTPTFFDLPSQLLYVIPLLL